MSTRVRKPDIIQYLSDYGKGQLADASRTVDELCGVAERYGLPWRWDEDTLTREVAGRLNDVLCPSVIWTHNPMGEHRHKRTGAKLKAFGVQSAWPDTTLIYRYSTPHVIGGERTLHIELKALPTAWRKEQKELAAGLVAAGHKYAVVRSLPGLERELAANNVPLKRGVRLDVRGHTG